MPALPRDQKPVDGEGGGLYTMAVASRLTGMHPQTLRKYERAGLITPSRQAGNQRLYSESDILRLRRIRYLVEERGVNIAGLARAELRAAVDHVADMSREPGRDRD